MPITEGNRKLIESILGMLVPQPYIGQLKSTLEFAEAEKKFNLRITHIDDSGAGGFWRVAVMEDGQGPYYEHLWAFGGRPYIRLYYHTTGKLYDVFLLPPP